MKKEASKVEEEKQGFADRLGLYIPVVKEDEEDVSTAKKMKFGQDRRLTQWYIAFPSGNNISLYQSLS